MMTGDVELEPDICWQAMHSRDPRFDGRFYVAAVTSGIYCRPICPVPFAKPNNIALISVRCRSRGGGVQALPAMPSRKLSRDSGMARYIRRRIAGTPANLGGRSRWQQRR